jgi:hypothetical protein
MPALTVGDPAPWFTVAAPASASPADALRVARKLENVFGNTEAMDEEHGFEIKWGSFWARTTAEKQGETRAMLVAGFPPT